MKHHNNNKYIAALLLGLTTEDVSVEILPGVINTVVEEIDGTEAEEDLFEALEEEAG